ncbi:TetR/AcrR family transcriptional regulator [Saliterribacillus persicus]|uniref:TetR family transcriptional regulator n=1 Tax=Saliterribacillus persicus TaxID=930114 RepID=A0A368YFG3_9BACI|nr:TetR/AcrR family transcriptional regulator [Saliterribacillus persicus]RCW76924.1 TetR family transcriptional regulator [Saliterribacillus persicus]
MKKIDPRVKKTRRSLKSAFVELIGEKGFDAITIQDISAKAEINRVTFYQHYQDKYDLLEKTIEDMLQNLIQNVSPESREDLIAKKDEPSVVFLNLFQFVYDHRIFFTTMFGENGVPTFQYRMSKTVQQFVSETIEELTLTVHERKVPKEIIVHYVTAASIGLITYWIETDMQYSPRYMAKQLALLEKIGPINAALGTH